MFSEVSKLTAVTYYKPYYKNYNEKRLKPHLKSQLPSNINIRQVNMNYKKKLNIN